jgi:hypothetical protein
VTARAASSLPNDARARSASAEAAPVPPPAVIRLSVVVTIVDGGAALERCLAGLAAQVDAPNLEVIVPWDESVAGIAAVSALYPGVRFVPMGNVQPKRPLRTPAGQHELFDRRRAAGLGVATGDLVAIVEDRGVPRPDWARQFATLHTTLAHQVIGGAVENGRDAPLNWAVYYCDFSRYQLPFAGGARDYVTDVNICYRRSALEATRALWQERYHETTVNWALRRAGEELYLAPESVVDEFRDDLSLGRLVRERVEWGRLFAYTRARESSIGKRIVWSLMTPVLPLVLFSRIARKQLGERRSRRRFARVAPVVLLLLACWSAGELAGYVTGAP